MITTNAESNLKSGFKTCGIFPLNPSKVVNKLPDGSCTAEDSTAAGTSASAAVDDSFTSLLHSVRYDNNATRPGRKRTIIVEPGKSDTGADMRDCDKEVSPADDDGNGTSNGNSDDDDNESGWHTDSSDSDVEHEDGGDDIDKGMDADADENNINNSSSSNPGDSSTGYTGAALLRLSNNVTSRRTLGYRSILLIIPNVVANVSCILAKLYR